MAAPSKLNFLPSKDRVDLPDEEYGRFSGIASISEYNRKNFLTKAIYIAPIDILIEYCALIPR